MQPPCNRFLSCFPRPSPDSEQVTARQRIRPAHTHAARVASKQQSRFNQPSFPTDSANSKYLSAPRSPPGLNQNEREPLCAAAVCGCSTKGGCCAASCGQADAPVPALTAVSFSGCQQQDKATAQQQWPTLPWHSQHLFQLLRRGWNPLVSGQLCHSEQNPTFVATERSADRKENCHAKAGYHKECIKETMSHSLKGHEKQKLKPLQSSWICRKKSQTFQTWMCGIVGLVYKAVLRALISFQDDLECFSRSFYLFIYFFYL